MRGLLDDLGKEDVRDALRVVIIRGISRENPHAYRVVLTSNPAALISSASSAKRLTVISRMCTMEPTSSENLRRFLDAYERSGEYALACGFTNPDRRDIHIAPAELHMRKCHIHLREAWEVGVHEIDSVGIRGEDDPILPDGGLPEAVPVLAVLQRLRADQK